MNRIESTFGSLARSGSGAFIPYVCAGDPDQSFTVELVKALVGAGADLVELGLPFSDPVADGPEIQRSMQRALSGGFKVPQVFGILSALRKDGVGVPIVLMTYYNPVLRLGIEHFCSTLSDAGADGILVVDLPPEESEELDDAASRHGLCVVRLVAPTTPDSRLDTILARSSGYLYAVSVSGTTGARDSFPPSAKTVLERIVPRSHIPVVLGFGISDPLHVRLAMQMGASGVVVGSKLASICADHSDDRRRAIDEASNFARAMKGATVGCLAGLGRPRNLAEAYRVGTTVKPQ